MQTLSLPQDFQIFKDSSTYFQQCAATSVGLATTATSRALADNFVQ